MNNDEELLILMNNIRSYVAVIAIGVYGVFLILVLGSIFILFSGVI